MSDDITRIIILDPDSSDPTWGIASESMTIDLTEREEEALLRGELSVHELVNLRKSAS